MPPNKGREAERSTRSAPEFSTLSENPRRKTADPDVAYLHHHNVQFKTATPRWPSPQVSGVAGDGLTCRLCRPVRLGQLSAELVADIRFRRNVQRLHAHGARAVAEALAEIGVRFGIQSAIDDIVQQYADLDPEALEAAGGTDFPPAPAHRVNL